MTLKSKRKKREDALKAPEKFIKQYINQQKSYTHYKLKVTGFIWQNRQDKRLNFKG